MVFLVGRWKKARVERTPPGMFSLHGNNIALKKLNETEFITTFLLEFSEFYLNLYSHLTS